MQEYCVNVRNYPRHGGGEQMSEPPKQKVYWSDMADEEKWDNRLGWGCPIWLWNVSPRWLRRIWLYVMEHTQ